MAKILSKSATFSAKQYASLSVDYSVVNYDDRVVFTTKLVATATSLVALDYVSANKWTVNGTQYSGKSGTVYYGGSEDASTAQTTTVYKTHSTQNVPFTATYTSGNRAIYRAVSGDLTISGTLSTTVAISAKTSYAVTFDLNGGNGSVGSQTKWYGETLTLSSVIPTKDGYTFKGWATSEANASAGTVDYASGASYTANAALTLYAVWELAYQKPTITLKSVERCDQNGNYDDEGKYALVTFDWAVYRTNDARYYGDSSTGPYYNNAVYECSVTVGSYTSTPTLTGASGTASVVVGAGTYDTDTPYAMTMSITDTQSIYSGTSTESGTLAMSTFPLDYNADASAVGFFMPAPDNGSGAYFARDINAMADILIDIDTSAGSGTDYEIYQALVSLGWDSDVLV